MLGSSKLGLYLSNPAGGGGGPAPAMLAVGHSTYPFISVYVRDGNSFSKIADPVDALPNFPYGMDWSPDGNILAVSHVSAPYLTIYRWNGSALEKMPNIDIAPPGTGYQCRWNPAGTSLAVAHSSSPFFSVYNFDGTDTFTRIPPANFSNPIGSTRFSVAWNETGTELFTAGTLSAGYSVTSWTRSGDNFTFTFGPQGPAVSVNSVAKDPLSARIALGNQQTGNGAQYVEAWTYNGSFWQKNSTFNPLPTSQAREVDWCPDYVDGKLLVAVAHYVSPFIGVYARVNNTYTRLSSPAALPASNAFGCRFDRVGTSLAVAHQSGDRFTVYDLVGSPVGLVKSSTTIDTLPTGNGWCVAWNH